MREQPDGQRGLAAQIVGRETELLGVSRFLDADAPSALVVLGAPGIGKSTLWDAGVGEARERAIRVLSSRASNVETQLAFTAVADLFEAVDIEALEGVPAPQARALQVALVRIDPKGRRQEPRAIDLGCLNALRALAARQPLLIAIDDAQWLDRASAETLAFAARRLADTPVRFFLTRRAGSRPALERALDRHGLERLELGPLSLGATRRMLYERLGLSLPRESLRRLVEASGGNPLFALELGRMLAESGSLRLGNEIPSPEIVDDLLGTRVARLPAPVRRLLLAVALSADPRASQLREVADEATIDAAMDSGLLVTDGDRLRPSHPLLAVAARRPSRAGERRELHHALARSAADEEARARHLALATPHPDGTLAAVVGAAAASAFRRGAATEAVELAEHALRLTPPDRAERTDRLLLLAEYLIVAGNPDRVTDLLSPLVESLPPGLDRARAHLLLSDGGGVAHVDQYQHHLDRALADCAGDAELRAEVLARQCTNTVVARVERIGEAEGWALEALPVARKAGPEAERMLLQALGWARILRGVGVDELERRHRLASDEAHHPYLSLDRVAAVRGVWRGELADSRAELARLLSLADERGEAWSYVITRLHICELELRAGEWDVVSRLLEEWEESSDGVMFVAPTYERCRALLAAGRGLPDEAERWASEAISGAEATGVRWDLLEALRARGIAALIARTPERAAESMRAVWAHALREGIGDPGAFPVAPDLVEALVDLGELGEAQAVTGRLGELARLQRHPWGLATTERCASLLQLASHSGETGAETRLQDAVAAYRALGLPFDAARSLLAAGRAQRRLKQWGAARRSLEQAAATFDEIGSPGWAELARSEVARVGARRPRPTGELTPAERRVVALAADGRSNDEIAQALFVSVHTIEAHLSHSYAKLGVRSRAQLARRVFAPEAGTAKV